MWVPLVENNEMDNPGADYFVKKNIDSVFQKDNSLDTLILGCTHYPLLIDVIKKYVPENVNILTQGAIVAEKLVDYLQRHPEMQERLTKGGSLEYQTTESAATFESKAALFMGSDVNARTVHL